jgi:phage gpG-like protein
VTKIRITVDNLGAVQKALDQYGAKAEKEIGSVLDAVGKSIINGVRKQMRSPKSGRVYKRGKRGRDHVASAPGEAPAVDTSFLINRSIYSTKVSPLEFIVGSNIEYSAHLEFGTRPRDGHPGIRPRPSWTLEVFAHREKMNKLVEAAIRRASQ